MRKCLRGSFTGLTRDSVPPKYRNFTESDFTILGDPGAASWDDGIVMGESLQQERESPWALTLTERVPEAFEIPPSD